MAENLLPGTREEVFDGEMVKNRRLPTVWDDAVNAVRNVDGTRVVQNLLIRIPMLSAVHRFFRN